MSIAIMRGSKKVSWEPLPAQMLDTLFKLRQDIDSTWFHRLCIGDCAILVTKIVCVQINSHRSIKLITSSNQKNFSNIEHELQPTSQGSHQESLFNLENLIWADLWNIPEKELRYMEFYPNDIFCDDALSYDNFLWYIDAILNSIHKVCCVARS